MKYPNLTPRMVFGTAAAMFLIPLTVLYPEWLIVPAIMALCFVVVYASLWVIRAIVDNEWPW